MEQINYKDLFPPDPSSPQRNYCNTCEKPLTLEFSLYEKSVSNIEIRIEGFPKLRCNDCSKTFYSDRSRFALINAWDRAFEAKSEHFRSVRKKTNEKFNYAIVDFLYDSDDYYYIPGLHREHSPGFLTPVFFNKKVLLKFDQLPNYRLVFSSRTYGSIHTETDQISFGINPNDKVVMWLGDIGTLPDSEQYYLRSENVESDHSLGSEFYDGQIECKFTDSTSEDSLIKARSEFLDSGFRFFSCELSHLDEELLQDIDELKRPIIFSKTTEREITSRLNRICVESLNTKNLRSILKELGNDAGNKGCLKLLEEILATKFASDGMNSVMCPFFVLYDLRIINSHLTSSEKAGSTIESAKQRLEIDDDADFSVLYDTLISRLVASYGTITTALNNENKT
jgi:hypothetical protein